MAGGPEGGKEAGGVEVCYSCHDLIAFRGFERYCIYGAANANASGIEIATRLRLLGFRYECCQPKVFT